MSYTKRELNAITLLLCILIFICLYLINSQISLLSSSNYEKSNTVYSKIIPIEKQNKILQTIKISDNIEDNLIKYTDKNETNTTKVSSLQQSMMQAEEEIKKAESEDSQNKKANQTQRQVIQENKKESWRIEIPKLALNVHIKEGTTSTVLLKAVGHLEGTSTWNGNVCLAAHNRGYNCNFFQKIKNLKIGDEIIYYTKQGKKVYKVQTNKTILETDWSYVKETQDNRITLITCEENRREYRRCVQAIQVAEYKN